MERILDLCRLEGGKGSMYVDPAVPYWFVPSTSLDSLLREVLRQGAEKGVAAVVHQGVMEREQARSWLERLDRRLSLFDRRPYPGRGRLLSRPVLRELWLHLTDACNLACPHCLFSSSPAARTALDVGGVEKVLQEAVALGCGLFYFTGGEPFVYPGFVELLARTQALDPTLRLVILTNGLLLGDYRNQLKKLDLDRVHLQVSLDGPPQVHDKVRGRGSFARLRENMALATDMGIRVTMAVAVGRENCGHLAETCRLAAELGAGAVHLMYHFQRGKGREQPLLSPGRLARIILEAAEVCDRQGMVMDNLATLEAQLFSTPGTRFDLSNAAWESMAVGPDGLVYPSPALVHVRELAGRTVAEGLERAFLESTVLRRIRNASLVDDPDWRQRPLALLTGGGDPDHSWVAGGCFAGQDPYLTLYEELMVSLAVRRSRCYPDQGMFRLCMGEVRHDCPQDNPDPVELTHCNCVVALAGRDGHAPVRDFYSRAALKTNEEIVNPHRPDRPGDAYIPRQARQRSYGCGSPVLDAAPGTGEVVVDLGSGSGVECFLAARKVGPEGRVFGIDMTRDMLALAREAKAEVVKELGYDNVVFQEGFLEDIPLPDSCADVVISNCVINLSPDKRKVFLEISRILKPGGRLAVADIVIDRPVPGRIARSHRWRGECLGGAMLQDDLLQLLEDCGFVRLRLLRRTLYREVEGHPFFSLTYGAEKSGDSGRTVAVFYRGPHPSLCTESGVLLERGRVRRVPESDLLPDDEAIFLLNSRGEVTNVEQEPCSCALAPEYRGGQREQKERSRAVPIRRHHSGCMVCGQELVYRRRTRVHRCHFCGQRVRSNSACARDHFVCDDCHRQEAMEVIRHICITSTEKDMVKLLTTIRAHPAVPMHGPEHHALVPGVILAAVRNSGGPLDQEAVLAGIERGGRVPGGACGFWGSCGAAIGAGIAAAVVLEATPLTPRPRQKAQEFTARILSRIAALTGGRCCQRETWTALKETARLSREFFGLVLLADGMLQCGQYGDNRECIGTRCPLWKTRQVSSGAGMIPLGGAAIRS